MEPFISRTIRLTLTATATACLALTATACDSTTTPAPSHTSTTASAKPSRPPAATPALDKQAALNLIRHYSQVNNRANVHDNARLLGTVEDGPLYAESLGGYKQDSGTAAKDRKPYKPWSYDAATAHLYIPTFAPGVPRWFAAGVTEAGTKYQVLIVFAQQPDRTWRMVFATAMDGMPLPHVALDAHGYATAVPTDGRNFLSADADHLRAAIVDDFTTGGKKAGTRYLAASPASKEQTDIHDKDTTRYGKKGTITFTASGNDWPDVYGLKTTDNGTLVLLSHTHTQTETTNPGWQINPGADIRAWLGSTAYRTVTDTFVCNDAALTPPAGKAHLLGYDCEVTDVTGMTAASFPDQM